MGIVFKQSLKNIVTSYLGFGVGAVNVIFLYPNFLDQEYYGLVTFLLSTGSLVWPFITFGVPSSIIKFYSSYYSRTERDKLLVMGLFLPAVAGLVLGLIGFFLSDFIAAYLGESNSLVDDYIWLIFVIAFSIAYFKLFFAWSKTQLKSVFGNFMHEVFHRIGITILLFLVYFEVIGVVAFLYLLTAVYVLRTLVMAFYSLLLYFPKFVFRLPKNKNAILKHSFLMFIAGSVAMVLLDLDKVQIGHFLPIENVSIYAIAIYIASVISVPSKAMHQITHPMTAAMLNRNDKVALRDLYKRSSVSLLVVGGLIFLLIICNVDQLYRMIPPEYLLGFNVVLLISLIKLYDNLLGNANAILFNSDYYRLVLYLGVLLAVLAFALNVWLIPVFGIYGAAYATFIAFFIYNSLKIIVVRWKFGLLPFNDKTLPILLTISVLGILFYFWDFPWHPGINIVLKSGLISMAYVFLMFRLNASEDISILIRKFLRRR